jgi:hypothetical protein
MEKRFSDKPSQDGFTTGRTIEAGKHGSLQPGMAIISVSDRCDPGSVPPPDPLRIAVRPDA